MIMRHLIISGLVSSLISNFILAQEDWKLIMHNYILEDVQFVGQDTGYAVGQSRKILRTIDGGETWNEQSGGISDIKTWLYLLHFVDSETGYAVGSVGVIMKKPMVEIIGFFLILAI